MKQLTNENFKEVLEGKGKRVIKLKSQGCVPCNLVGQTLEEIEGNYPSIEFIEADAGTPQGRKLAIQLQVMSVPTLAFIVDGEVKTVLQGMQSKATIEKHLEEM